MRFEKTVPVGMLIRMLAVMTLFAALAVVASAQSEPAPPPPPGPGVMLHGPRVGFFHEEIGDDKVVTGAPMTVVLTTSRDQSLSDGNTIHNSHQATVYRDSQGRVRRDVQFELATTATGASTHNMTVITDPVAGKRYMLNTDRKVAHETPIRPPKPPAGELSEGPPWKSGDNVTTEQLGTKTIMGLQATGTRLTRTIPAGEIGNAKAINVVTERWVSNDLQIPLETTHTDPMMGTVTTKVTSVNRGEPDASLFQVPADYKVEAGHRGDVMYFGKP